MKILVKYHNDALRRLERIDAGDWIDLRAAENVTLRAGEFKLISLGVSMKLPDGYEAWVAPRSSTFKTWHILQANGLGIVDNSYSGDDDVWKFPAYAVRDTAIKLNDRICQFRIAECMPRAEFEEVSMLGGSNRNGFGSTGTR
jgi:dUTP pyrophosphatase